MIFATTKQRILEFIDFKSIKVKDFLELTNIKRGFLDSDKLNSTVSDVFIASIIAKFPEINPIWLITGNGEMILDNELNTKREISENHSDAVPLYQFEAAAGDVHLFNDHKHSKPIAWIQGIPNLPKCDGAIYITGDSMYPLLKSHDIVAYKTVKDLKNHTFIWGEMYLIDFDNDGDDQLLVKWMQKSDVEGCVKLVSENRHHSPIDLKIEKIRSLAIVKATIRTNSMR